MSVKLNRYAQFVKEHYAEVKHQTPQGGHKAVMQKLRENYYSSSKTPTLEHWKLIVYIHCTCMYVLTV